MRFITFLGARIGFEERFYQVNETSGTVELCAVVFEPDVDCPIEFAFNVTFETSDISAGTCMSIIFMYQSIFHLHHFPICIIILFMAIDILC